MKKYKYVESWHVALLPNGIYMVVFNLTEKGLTHHRYNDQSYWFGRDEQKYEVITIPKFLPDGKYLKSSDIDKHQCTYYYMPYSLETVINSKSILTSENESIYNR